MELLATPRKKEKNTTNIQTRGTRSRQGEHAERSADTAKDHSLIGAASSCAQPRGGGSSKGRRLIGNCFEAHSSADAAVKANSLAKTACQSKILGETAPKQIHPIMSNRSRQMEWRGCGRRSSRYKMQAALAHTPGAAQVHITPPRRGRKAMDGAKEASRGAGAVSRSLRPPYASSDLRQGARLDGR